MVGPGRVLGMILGWVGRYPSVEFFYKSNQLVHVDIFRFFSLHIKVEPPKTNNNHKTNTKYHMHTLGASKCTHVVHSVGFAIAVGFGWFYLD